MKRHNWNVELVSWENSCNRWLKEWVLDHGLFLRLDDFYHSITHIKSSEHKPEWGHRPASPLELRREAQSKEQC